MVLLRTVFTKCVLIILLFQFGFTANAQEKQTETREGALRVFLDRFRRNEDYIKREIPYVNYVRDTRQAQVYILLTQQDTGSGGAEYTLTFVGQENFTGITDTLKYIAKQSDTDEIRRQGIVKYLQLGMVQYISKTPFAEEITILHSGRFEEQEQQPIDDKWDYWFFRINVRGNVEAEESSNEMSLGGSVSANKITEDWKVSLRFSPDYSESDYETSEGDIRTFRRQNEFNGLIVKSINNHWSAGIISKILSDTRINTDLSIAAGPAIEYNIFPYSLSTRKQCAFRLGLWSMKTDYDEETIFDKTRETLFYSSLSVSGQIIERWGDVRTTLEGNVYFHDPGVNKLEWDTNFDIRISRGLSINCGFEASLIHDQLYISKEDIPVEEILLQRKQLQTNWSYDFRIGLSYIFGSQYNNIVNPRFGSAGERDFRGRGRW